MPEETVSHMNNNTNEEIYTEKDNAEAKNNTEVSVEDVQKELIEVNLMKEEFEELEYDLPPFESLSEDFDVEKAYEKDSSFLLREIRKIMIEKLSAYLQLFETFMNPTSPPMFIFSALRNLGEDDKAMIKQTYKDLAKYQLLSVKLDTVYNEKNEAAFIMQGYTEWQELKPKVYSLIEKLEQGPDEETAGLKNGYFG